MGLELTKFLESFNTKFCDFCARAYYFSNIRNRFIYLQYSLGLINLCVEKRNKKIV